MNSKGEGPRPLIVAQRRNIGIDDRAQAEPTRSGAADHQPADARHAQRGGETATLDQPVDQRLRNMLDRAVDQDQVEARALALTSAGLSSEVASIELASSEVTSSPIATSKAAL